MCGEGEGGLVSSGVGCVGSGTTGRCEVDGDVPDGSAPVALGSADAAGVLGESASVALGSADAAGGSADAVDEGVLDDGAEDEMAQRVEDIPVHESVQSGVVLNGSPLLCQKHYW